MRGGAGVSVSAALLFIAWVLGAASGCKRERVIAGFGKWNVTTTKRRDATGRCEPTDLADGRKATWCFGQRPVAIVGRSADVDLYFEGSDDNAKAIEIQFSVRGCQVEKTFNWLREVFGPSSAATGPWTYWENEHLLFAAGLPSEPGRCHLRLFPVSERREYERVRGTHKQP